MIGPATYGVGAALGASGLDRLLDPLDLPRRGLWNSVHALMGGGALPPRAPQIPSLGEPGEAASGPPGMLGPRRSPGDKFGGIPDGWESGMADSSKDWRSVLPLALGLGAGALTGGLGFGAWAIPAALGAMGLTQAAGESGEMGDPDKFRAPETDSVLLKMIGDPMNLLGVTGYLKGPALGEALAGKFTTAGREAAAAAERMAATEGRLGQIASEARTAMSPQPFAEALPRSGEGLLQNLSFKPLSAPQEMEQAARESVLLNALGRPEERVGAISDILDRRLGGAPSTPAMNPHATMEDIFLNPMAIPDRATSILRRSSKPPAPAYVPKYRR